MPAPVVRSIRLSDLPVNNLFFLSEKAFVAAGFDFNPLVFTGNNSSGECFTDMLVLFVAL
jgi:hypothetical protein